MAAASEDRVYHLRSRGPYNLRPRTTNVHSGTRDGSGSQNSTNSNVPKRPTTRPTQPGHTAAPQRQRPTRIRTVTLVRRNHSGQQQAAVSPSISQQSPQINNDSDDGSSSSSDIKCAICLDTVNSQEMEFIVCGHSFHRECCDNWLMRNNVCPVCRMVVPMPMDDDDDNSSSRSSHRRREHRRRHRHMSDGDLDELYDLFRLTTQTIVINVFGI